MTTAIPGNVLPLSPGTMYRGSKVLRDQLIYTLFLKEEATNTLFFTIRALAYTDKIAAGKLANSFIDCIKNYVEMTGSAMNIPAQYNQKTQEDDNPSITYISNIVSAAASGVQSSLLYFLTYAGLISFNLYFRANLDFMLAYSIPYLAQHHNHQTLLYAKENPDMADYYYSDENQLVNIKQLRMPLPQTLTRVSHSLQLSWNYASFYMFVCEEGLQCIQYAIRHLIFLDKDGNGPYLAGRLANWWMEDLLGLITFTNSPLFAGITRGASAIGFNSYFRSVYQLFRSVKGYYTVKNELPLKENEYWDLRGEIPLRKTYNIHELGLDYDASFTLNPITRNFVRRL